MGYGSDPLKEKMKEWDEEAQVVEWEEYERYVVRRDAQKKIKRLDAMKLVLEEEIKRQDAIIEEQTRRNGLKRETEENGTISVLHEVHAIASHLKEFKSKCKAEWEKFEVVREAFEELEINVEMNEEELQELREKSNGFEVQFSKMRLEHKNLVAELEKLKSEVDRLEAEIPSHDLQNRSSPSPDPYSSLGRPVIATSLSVMHAGSSGSLNVQSDQLVPEIPNEEDRVKIIGTEVDGGAIGFLEMADSEA